MSISIQASMNDLSTSTPPAFKLTRLYWIGLIVFAAACGPHLLFNLASGTGYISREAYPRLALWLFLPALLSFLPSLICMAWGIGQSVVRHVKARKYFHDPASRPLPEPPSGQPKFKLKGMFWFGLIVFLGCCGPLLSTLVYSKLQGTPIEQDRNSVIFGTMAGITFWPSILTMVVGLMEAIFNHHKAKKAAH